MEEDEGTSDNAAVAKRSTEIVDLIDDTSPSRSGSAQTGGTSAVSSMAPKGLPLNFPLIKDLAEKEMYKVVRDWKAKLLLSFLITI